MRDLDKALSDIVTIRGQIAAATAFQGYGPAAIASTGVLALVTTAMQAVWLGDPSEHAFAFFAGWVATAILSAAVIGIEMRARAYRHHSGLADAMIYNAIGQFLPAGLAGALLCIVFALFESGSLWMLPGLWQILVGIGIFASLRSLPGNVAAAGVWYFAAGLFVLITSSYTHMLSPWTMGLPFVGGQLLLGALLHFAPGGDDA
jgi:hypothetical protein